MNVLFIHNIYVVFIVCNIIAVILFFGNRWIDFASKIVCIESIQYKKYNESNESNVTTERVIKYREKPLLSKNYFTEFNGALSERYILRNDEHLLFCCTFAYHKTLFGSYFGAFPRKKKPLSFERNAAQ